MYVDGFERHVDGWADSTRETRAGTTTTTVDGARARDDPARVRVRVVVVVGEGGGDVRDVETRVVDDALDATDGVGDDDDARAWFALALALVVGVVGILGVKSRARARRARGSVGVAGAPHRGDERRARRRGGDARVRGCRGDGSAREREARARLRRIGVRGRGGECGDALGRTGRDGYFAARGETPDARRRSALWHGPSVDAAAMVRSNGETVVSRAGARGMSGGNVGNSTVVKTRRRQLPVPLLVGGDHARRGQSAVREQLEVKKLEAWIELHGVDAKADEQRAQSGREQTRRGRAARGENPKPSRTSFTVHDVPTRSRWV